MVVDDFGQEFRAAHRTEGLRVDEAEGDRPVGADLAVPTDDAAAQLSDREFQILRLLAQGLSVNQIADQLVISNKTVSTHKTRLMEKMGFTCNADIIKYAMTHGLTA